MAVAGVLAAVGGLAISAARASALTIELSRAAWSFQRPASELASAAIQVLLEWLVPPLVALFLATLLVGWAQAGCMLTPALVAPDAERLSPAAGAKRLWSSQRLFSVLRAAALLGLIAWTTGVTLADIAPVLLRLPRARCDVGGWALEDALLTFARKLLAVFAAYAVLDWALALMRHRRQLRMSRDEIRREQRESEGDPLIKGQRKALHRSLVGAAVARGVRSAHVVVVNPTHIAVGLRYAPREAEAPFVVARGREEEAFALREEARRAGIPIVRDIPLARSLIRLAPGEEVPEELYRAAAAILGMLKGEVQT